MMQTEIIANTHEDTVVIKHDCVPLTLGVRGILHMSYNHILVF